MEIPAADSMASRAIGLNSTRLARRAPIVGRPSCPPAAWDLARAFSVRDREVLQLSGCEVGPKYHPPQALGGGRNRSSLAARPECCGRQVSSNSNCVAQFCRVSASQTLIQAGAGSNESPSKVLADRTSEDSAKQIAGSRLSDSGRNSPIFSALTDAPLLGSSARQTDCHLSARKRT
jgi:hypothetical protein